MEAALRKSGSRLGPPPIVEDSPGRDPKPDLAMSAWLRFRMDRVCLDAPWERSDGRG